MKFIHMADMHFDTAFTSLENRKNLHHFNISMVAVLHNPLYNSRVNEKK